MPQKMRVKDEFIQRYIDSLKDEVTEEMDKWYQKRDELIEDVDMCCLHCGEETVEFWKKEQVYICRRCKKKW